MERNLEKLMDLQEMALGYRDDRDSIEDYKNYRTNDDILNEAKYILSTYYEFGHANNEIKEESPKKWRSDVAKLKRFIARLEKVAQ